MDIKNRPNRLSGSRSQLGGSSVSRSASKSSIAGGARMMLSRAMSMQGVVIIIGVILMSRLFYLQVIKHGHYQDLAIAEHQKKFEIPATRGTLYFRDGEKVVPAVLNDTLYTLYGDPNTVQDVDKASTVIADNTGMARDEIEELLKKKDTSYVVIKKRLTKDQVDKLFKNKSDLVGVNVTPVPQRVYPEGLLGGQTLGFVNDEGVGQYGVEAALNDRLAGQVGELKAITDVNGVPLSLDDATNVAKQPEDGQNLVLTIDRNIQAEAEKVLSEGLKNVSATKGSIIVLDPNTGAVKAMANLPGYDPAKYFELGSDAYERFQNRAVTSAYEAGSVIKVLTMAAGLDSGAVSPSSTFYNSGQVQVDDATIKNVEQDVNGTRTMTDVLKYSLNTGVIHVLSQMGGGSINDTARQRLYDYFTNRYGFGSSTGIEQSGEVSGSIFAPDSEQGNNVRYSNMSFGQGMNVTMVQAASAFSAVVNGGNYYQPHLVEGQLINDEEVDTKQPKPERTKVVSGKTSAEIRAMTATALRESPAVSSLVKPGYNVGGKTGTSQIIDPNTGKYIEENAIGSYLGFGGDDKPRYVIMVRVDDSKLGAQSFAGSSAAAPIFGNLSNWLIDYYNIKPMEG